MYTFHSHNSKCTKGYTAKNQPNFSLSNVPINQFSSSETFLGTPFRDIPSIVKQIHIHLFPPLEPPSHLPSIPPLLVITEHGGELPVLYSHFPLASCLTHGNVYMCQCYPLSSSHLLLPRCVHKSVLYV